LTLANTRHPCGCSWHRTS